MLTHLDDAPADGLHVTQVAERCFTQPRDQPTLCRLVAQALQPGIELGQGLDDLHKEIVIVRLHSGKVAISDEGPRWALQNLNHVERVIGIEPTRRARFRAPDELLTDDGGPACD